MQESPVQPFDDPALKAALRRTLGRDSAPAALRDRIKGLTAAAPLPEGKPIPLFRRSPAYRYAVAAVLVIGFGGLAYQIWQMNRPPVYNQAYAIPNSFYKAMIATHTGRLEDKLGGDSVTTLASASSLGGQIQRPVLVADLTKDGWTFKGGAVRKVGADDAAQLFFTKGNAAISVFSLPASAVPKARDGESYDTRFDASHAIAGFTRSGGLFCVVGSSEDGSLSVDEVKRLLETHKGEISKG